MGLKIFSKDGIFYPADYSLVVGDTLDVVLVGGGNSPSSSIKGGTKGEDSFFGTYATALGGNGAPGGVGRSDSLGIYGAGGGGGFVPGATFQGGAGLCAPAAHGVYVYQPNTNGGGASSRINAVSGISSTGAAVFAANGENFGGGYYSSSARPGNLNGGSGGAGYGAGGGTSGDSGVVYAGNAGEIVYYSHILTQEDIDNGIPCTIGVGYNPQNSKTASVSKDSPETTNIKLKKNIVPFISSGVVGALGVFKTFELTDGTYGLREANSQSDFPTMTTHVKFTGVDKVIPFSKAFPQFSSYYTYPIYSCGDYYVQISPLGTKECKVRWVNKNRAQEESLTKDDYGEVIYSSKVGEWTPNAGFINNDFVIFNSSNATDYRIYRNWNPSTTDFEERTCASSVHSGNQNHSNQCLIETESGGLALMRLSDTQESARDLVILKDYNVGSTETLKYCQYAVFLGPQGRVGRSQYMMYGSSNTSGYVITNMINSSTTNIGATKSLVPFYLGGKKQILVSSSSSGTGDFLAITPPAFYPGEDDSIVYCPLGTQLNNFLQQFPGLMTPAGYDNHAGVDGGAGGCCMITW